MSISIDNATDKSGLLLQGDGDGWWKQIDRR